MNINKKILTMVFLFLAILAISGCNKGTTISKQDQFYYFEAEDYADLSNWFIDNNIIGHTGLGYLISAGAKESELLINPLVSNKEYFFWVRDYSFDEKKMLYEFKNQTYEIGSTPNKWEWKKICRCDFEEISSFTLIKPSDKSKIIIDAFLFTTSESFDPNKELIETGLSIESLQENYRPIMEFDAKNFRSWQQKLKAKLEEVLGNPHNKRSDLRAITFQKIDEGSYTRQRVVFHSTNNTIVNGYLLIPKFVEEKIPAIIALPARNTNKEVLSGRTIFDIASDKKDYNTYYKQAYALDLVNNGYIVLAIDLPYYNERYLSDKDYQYALYNQWSGGDTIVSQAVTDIISSIDYLETRKEIDKNRIGIVGLSLGGDIALLASAIDNRLKATISSSALATYDSRIIKKQLDEAIIPIKKYAETSDIVLLIAPRGLFIESSGENDPIVSFDGTIIALEKIKQGYEAIDKSYNFGYEVAGNETLHAFIGNKSLQWLNEVMDYTGIYNEDEKITKSAIYRKDTYMSLSETYEVVHDSAAIDSQAINIGDWLAVYDNYPPGDFSAGFRIRAEETENLDSNTVIARLVINEAGYPTDEAEFYKEITVSEFGQEYNSFIVDFKTDKMMQFQFVILKTSSAKIILDKIFVMPKKSD